MPVATYRKGTWVFTRITALCFLMAFWSLWSQIDGLVGVDGILPAEQTASAVLDIYGKDWIFAQPSLYFLDPTDATLHRLCWWGVLFSILALLDISPGLCFLGCWALYLSLANCSGLFLGYQWDTLLTEVGFAAVFVAPWARRPHSFSGPPRLARWGLWLIALRLMFFAGWVKLASGDDTWASCTALTYHYWSQALPNPLSWHAHQLPEGFHRWSCEQMFRIELWLPAAVLLGRWGRLLFALGGIALMLGLALTGNYGFFQLLTIGLLFSLIDDKHLFWMPFRLRLVDDVGSVGRPQQPLLFNRSAPFAVALIMTGVLQATTQTVGYGGLQPRAQELLISIAPWRTVNRYGLFAVMTTTRPEIRIEGSADGREWHTYEFFYKPDALDMRPAQAAPHMPRVDWQMWFAALGSCERNAWLQRMNLKLLEGSDPVEGLFAHNPFPDDPPHFIRTTVQNYVFTDVGEEGWWKPVGTRRHYCPTVQRR